MGHKMLHTKAQTPKEVYQELRTLRSAWEATLKDAANHLETFLKCCLPLNNEKEKVKVELKKFNLERATIRVLTDDDKEKIEIALSLEMIARVPSQTKEDEGLFALKFTKKEGNYFFLDMLADEYIINNNDDWQILLDDLIQARCLLNQKAEQNNTLDQVWDSLKQLDFPQVAQSKPNPLRPAISLRLDTAKPQA